MPCTLGEELFRALLTCQHRAGSSHQATQPGLVPALPPGHRATDCIPIWALQRKSSLPLQEDIFGCVDGPSADLLSLSPQALLVLSQELWPLPWSGTSALCSPGAHICPAGQVWARRVTGMVARVLSDGESDGSRTGCWKEHPSPARGKQSLGPRQVRLRSGPSTPSLWFALSLLLCLRLPSRPCPLVVLLIRNGS